MISDLKLALLIEGLREAKASTEIGISIREEQYLQVLEELRDKRAELATAKAEFSQARRAFDEQFTRAEKAEAALAAPAGVALTAEDIDRIVPAIDPVNPVPLDEDKHYIEWMLYKYTERVRGELFAIVEANKKAGG